MPTTVMSYNIQEGGGDRLPAIAGVIAAAHPDAVALLEATSRPAAERLAARLGMSLAFGEANNGIHVAWLSRLLIRRWANHRLPALAKTLLEIEVDAAGAPLRLFATHLASRHDQATPAAEVAAILGVLASLAAHPHLLVGDLNALHPDDAVGEPPPGIVPRGEAVAGIDRPAIRHLLDAGYLDCYRARHPTRPGYTYPSTTPWLRLDYCFAPPTLADRLIDAGVRDEPAAIDASDHLPVWATFR